MIKREGIQWTHAPTFRPSITITKSVGEDNPVVIFGEHGPVEVTLGEAQDILEQALAVLGDPPSFPPPVGPS